VVKQKGQSKNFCPQTGLGGAGKLMTSVLGSHVDGAYSDTEVVDFTSSKRNEACNCVAVVTDGAGGALNSTILVAGRVGVSKSGLPWGCSPGVRFMASVVCSLCFSRCLFQ